MCVSALLVTEIKRIVRDSEIMKYVDHSALFAKKATPALLLLTVLVRVSAVGPQMS